MKAMPFVKGCCRQLILFGKENALELLHFCQVATASCSCPFGKDTVLGITFVKWLLQHALFLLSRKLCFSFWQGSFAFPFVKEALLFLLTRKLCFSFWQGSFAFPFGKEDVLSALAKRKQCFSFWQWHLAHVIFDK